MSLHAAVAVVVGHRLNLSSRGGELLTLGPKTLGPTFPTIHLAGDFHQSLVAGERPI